MGLAVFATNAFKKYVRPKIVFGNKDRATEAKYLDGNDEDGSQTDLSIDDFFPMGVFKTMALHNNTLPPEMIREFHAKINNMGTTRDQTIGKFLKQNLIL